MTPDISGYSTAYLEREKDRLTRMIADATESLQLVKNELGRRAASEKEESDGDLS